MMMVVVVALVMMMMMMMMLIILLCKYCKSEIADITSKRNEENGWARSTWSMMVMSMMTMMMMMMRLHGVGHRRVHLSSLHYNLPKKLCCVIADVHNCVQAHVIAHVVAHSSTSSSSKRVLVIPRRKFAMLEVLEIDQYIWAILKYVSGTRFDEVVIDSKGNWKPTTYNDISDAGAWKRNGGRMQFFELLSFYASFASLAGQLT